MKIVLITILLLISPLIAAYGQNPEPPGTIRLNNNLFIDKTPITNMMFLEYLTIKEYLKTQGYESWNTYYVDKDVHSVELNLFYPTLIEELKTKKSLVSRRGYFDDPIYKESPVLRITESQAKDYCQWRTEMVEYAWNTFPKFANQKEFANRIQYRLPSVEELEAAKIHFSEKDQFVSISEKNPLRYKSMEVSEKFMQYNISEFTSSDELYGENWKDVVPNEFPNDYTGFRCVCEVRDK